MPKIESAYTTAPIAIPERIAVIPIQPEFIRLPKNGLCPWTGLSRSGMNDLILSTKANGNRPPVKSVCLRRPGAKRGARLIHLRSLLDYLHQHEQGGVATDPMRGGDKLR